MVNDLEEMMEEQMIRKSLKIKLYDWMKRRWQFILMKESAFIISFSLIFMLSLCVQWVLVIPGIPTGLGIIFDYLIFGSLYVTLLIIAFILLKSILAFFYLHKCASMIASSAILITQSYLLMMKSNWGWKVSIFMTAVIMIITIVVALYAAYLHAYRKKTFSYILSNLVILFLVVALGNEVRQHFFGENKDLITQLYEDVLLNPGISQSDEDSSADISDDNSAEMDLDGSTEQVLLSLNRFPINPAQPGSYEVRHYDYESYADDTDLMAEEVEDIIYTAPMDGSDVLKDWKWTKELYWGFSEDQIPINGQVWTPVGEGEFPIVFIMHGNHVGEEDSSDGYAYLGELLASQGMIVCSIDANFLNYSVWSGIVDDDQLLRSWLMLAHITSFYEQQYDQLSIDWDQVALIGHSRGGQAAAMAVDAKKWLVDNEITNILEKVSIKAVVGIAPTDYRVDSKQANLYNVNYLTLHGTMDSDLTESFGDRQYERTRLNEEGHFKATVELYHANHGQFNTVWGKYDEQFPGAILLNTEDLMSGDDQRQAAQIYISSFLQASLLQQDQFKAIFQDFRTVGQYLPPTGYVTRYSSSDESLLFNFERDYEEPAWSTSTELEAEVIELKGRSDGDKQNSALWLQWVGEQQHITFNLSKQQQYMLNKNIEAITISFARTEYRQKEDSSKEDEFKTKTENSNANLNSSVTNIEEETLKEQNETTPSKISDPIIEIDKLDVTLPVELELYSDLFGSIQLDLASYFSLLAPAEDDFTKSSLLEERIKKGKYDVNVEPLLQTYIIPIDLFGENINLSDMEQISLYLNQPSGSLIVDNIGVITEGGTYVQYNR
ncbi:MAG: hypothetical protein NAG76_21150 [Candidatus Pristimantibacillus lignocellulolyticus]|uniref:Alpha/beta hydrolase family protein n=1 Tax=Candidatus Pristimantibacillus lignocellulolyticus TaxID=2994561 RepID=A0A9J6ZES7_9BACL|nr:MAG: hypothetical protein NAG76_21150 [Candidatus Pristimantibacillus lignocellulolyticus]